jgi:hypothetical protein
MNIPNATDIMLRFSGLNNTNLISSQKVIPTWGKEDGNNYINNITYEQNANVTINNSIGVFKPIKNTYDVPIGSPQIIYTVDSNIGIGKGQGKRGAVNELIALKNSEQASHVVRLAGKFRTITGQF